MDVVAVGAKGPRNGLTPCEVIFRRHLSPQAPDSWAHGLSQHVGAAAACHCGKRGIDRGVVIPGDKERSKVWLHKIVATDAPLGCQQYLLKMSSKKCRSERKRAGGAAPVKSRTYLCRMNYINPPVASICEAFNQKVFYVGLGVTAFRKARGQACAVDRGIERAGEESHSQSTHFDAASVTYDGARSAKIPGGGGGRLRKHGMQDQWET